MIASVNDKPVLVHRPAPTGREPLHVVWLHDSARRTGGCESYMINTAQKLRSFGVTSTLLYGEAGDGPLDMLTEFDRAFPIVDLEQQLPLINPDVIYAHRISGCDMLSTVTDSGIPTLRFFHDHKLFCPREHKYTTLGKQTCTKPIGWNCYSCLGVVNRSPNWPGIQLRPVGQLKAEQRAHDGLAGYVVGSQYMRSQLIDHHFAAHKVHVLPLYAEAPEDCTVELRDPHHMLFVGQVVRGKGVDVLLRALAECRPQIRLTIVGTGAQLNEFQQLANELNVGRRVTFAGKLSATQIKDLYRTAGCLLVPSRSPETFGQVGVEAMSHGMPVIASRVGGIGEWLHHGESGLFCEPNDVKSLTVAIDTMARDEQLQTRLRRGALRIYRQKFQPSRHVDQLAELLTQVAQHRSE